MWLGRRHQGWESIVEAGNALAQQEMRCRNWKWVVAAGNASLGQVMHCWGWECVIKAGNESSGLEMRLKRLSDRLFVTVSDKAGR